MKVQGKRPSLLPDLSRAAWCVVGAALFVAFFAEFLLGGEVYYPGDAARVYIPERVALKRSLSRLTFPWWDRHLGIGYPLLAEGQTAAFYPLNWLLFGLFAQLGLDPATALSVAIVLHYLIAGLGFWALGRELGLAPAATFLGAMAFSLGGFLMAHLSHVGMLSVAAWMPWTLALTQRLWACARRRSIWGVLLALVVALQFVAGHAQVSLLLLLAAGAYAFWLAMRTPHRQRLAPAMAWLLAVAVGTFLALPQLVPGLELARLSQRAGGLEEAFFTSYSFHPFLIVTYLSPFLLGNPYPQGSVELMAYLGLLPLGLAALAVWRGRGGTRWFLAGLGAVGLALALGRWNPLYRLLLAVPPFNLFRVPARYLLWTSLALSVLAAMGADMLLRAAPPRSGRSGFLLLSVTVVASVLAVAAAVVWRGTEVLGTEAARNVNALVAAWRWLPLLLGAGVGALGLAASRASARAWVSAATLLLAADLYAYGAVLDGTYNATWPRQEALTPPASLGFLAQQEGLYRLYTKEEIVPALSVLRESLYPNTAAAWGLDSANLYMPLVPQSYEAYLRGLDAQRLNKVNVRYLLIPQLLPVDEAAELYDVENPFSALPTGRWLEIEPRRVEGIVVESYLSHSVGLANGEPAAELWLRDISGDVRRLPLRAGLESAEWAYERDDVRQNIAHALPEVASTWPARSGFPPREHVGHTYRATWRFDPPLTVKAVLLRPILPAAFVRVERVRFQGQGQETLLAHLLGLGDHEIVYRSEDVLIYRNNDALPRAYVLDQERVIRRPDGTLCLPATIKPTEVRPTEVVRYEDMLSEWAVEIERPGYFILADLYYPGWSVTVDGRAAPIIPMGDGGVGGVFRAVALPPGRHELRFVYRPFSLDW